MNTRIHRLFPTFFVLGACVLLFLGERAFAGDDKMRMIFAGLAALAVGLAELVRFNELRTANDDRRPVARRLLTYTAGAASALVLYSLIAVVFVDDTPTHERMRGVLWALWPIVLIASLAPMIAIELAVAPVAYIGRYEHARVRKNAVRALAFAIFVACLVLGNYLADRHDKKWELSAGHQPLWYGLVWSVVRSWYPIIKPFH